MRNWKIGLGVALILIILIALILLFRPARQILVYSVPLCNTLMEKPIVALIEKDFPDPWIKFSSSKIAEVMAVNDIRCEVKEYMANVAIILSDGRKTMFGIFHIHFTSQEIFLSSSPILPWKKYQDRNDPKIDAAWQSFIKTVYPMQTKKPE